MYKIIRADGREYGTVSADQIREWLEEGRVNSQTRIKFADASAWQTLASLPEFATELAAHPSPPPSSRPTASVPSKTSGLAVASLLDGRKDCEVNPRTVMFFESRAGWNATGGPGLFAAHKHSTTGIVVGFADGSVQQLPRSQLETLRWEP